MSEYQFYEFQAVDRPLTPKQQDALRDLSSRAKITATGFVNEYSYGEFRGRPDVLMQDMFDLHMYMANWGSRRLMVRVPARLVDRPLLDHICTTTDSLRLKDAGEQIILDISREELGSEWLEGAGYLATLAPFRADIMAGDPRLFYLIWLMAVEDEGIEPDEAEPMPGIGPMTEAMTAFANFFHLDIDLVSAAAEHDLFAKEDPAAAGPIIAGWTKGEKDALLRRLHDGDTGVAAEVRARVREAQPKSDAPRRTAGDLLARAAEIEAERAAAARKKEQEKTRQAAEQAKKAQRARIAALLRRGDSVWQDIEAGIETRNAKGYDEAAELLGDMHIIAEENGRTVEFSRRVAEIRERHTKKKQFLFRIEKL